MKNKNKEKKERKQLPWRLNVLFFIVFLLFSALILRLGIVQIVQGSQFTKQLNQTDEVTVNTSMPRGQIFDRNGNLIVGNKGLRAITYTRKGNVQPQDMLNVAEKLAAIINQDSTIDVKSITLRDRQDFWILKNPDAAKALITKADMEKYKNNPNSNDLLYQLQLSRIPKSQLNFSKSDLDVLAIYRLMAAGTKLTPVIIKNQGVTDKEFAYINENLDKLPGVDTEIDWERYNTFATKNGQALLNSILGNVSTAKEGLPSDLANYYLSQGYSRNDRVGKSYLEYEYENVLQGKKEVVKDTPDTSGNVVGTQVISPGQRGDDIQLTIDAKFQAAVEKIIEDLPNIEKASIGGYQPYSDRAFVTAMNPNTGEILAMAGKEWVKNKKTGGYDIQDYALGNINSAYPVGSVAKPATLLTAYQVGAINFNTRFNDDGYLKFAGTPMKKSWNVSGLGDGLTDLQALAKSSNVYMWRVAMAVGGQKTYVPNMKLNINKVDAMDKFRKYFSEFGLGVKTGIDLPGESSGVNGGMPDQPGKVLDFAIGQFDTYTPLQLAQYISTIANGGYRMQPHIAKDIRTPSTDMTQLGPVSQDFEPTVLNQVDFSQQNIDHVKQGLIDVLHGPHGTGVGHFPLSDKYGYKVAGKTGTAQSVYVGERSKSAVSNNMWNETFIGYAPYDNPQIAISVIVPYTNSETHANLTIADRVFDAYFQLQKQEENSQNANDPASETQVANVNQAKAAGGQ
ncbi:peptidoglycan D,D-transpeptidase FtsI family protein [Heyndrickxia acidicola]|uniref:serine-type D-Ala-D-Ala carboxypeptidase n=1 Tax=Heyndrickxia acidicola TaxID=209389 RepID=A0ABU6MP03_9BACI|nr:penicillin-binding protein 2 [Heyndrickxia acidicola]MED1206054.1 penicillin-binding protein 2 [Heyndrickxia acidicola]